MRFEKGMQESDMLDQLPDGKEKADDVTSQIMLVSLGCFCGPKLSFKHIGRGAETLPFDWMRTRHCGLLHFLRNNFADFFDFMTKKSVPGCNMTTYRHYYHSFWHDDPTDPGMLERYKRRIQRFQSIDARTKQVLFVRCLASTDEIQAVPDLLEALMENFGPHAYLLFIIDFQLTACGPALVAGYPNLMVYYSRGEEHVGEDGETPVPPYAKAVLTAQDWLVGRTIAAMQFVSMEKIIECADETHWGLGGLGGLLAFEESLQGAPEEQIAGLPEGKLPNLPAISSAALVKEFLKQDAAEPAHTLLVPLGCSGLVKACILQMGNGNLELPFDWIRISHDGLLHFLRKGFLAETRPGLGAGNQRPAEKEGFFDVVTRKHVPGTSLVMGRSHLHSIWHDDTADPAVRAKFKDQFDAFDRLPSLQRPLLFVRAVATSSEISRADELLAALVKKFDQASLLLICDFQTTRPGCYVVDGMDELLVYFLEPSAHDPHGTSYKKAIETGLQWLEGAELEANGVPDLRTLQELADETRWGLLGMAGFLAFEAIARLDGVELDAAPAAAAEDAWLRAVKLESAKDSLAVLSLGSSSILTEVLQTSRDLSSEASPFDSARITLPGLVSALKNDFEDIFRVSKTEKVPGMDITVHRSTHHSFWETGEGTAERDVCKRSLESFRCWQRSSRPKLFVRVAASSEELAYLGVLRQTLVDYFADSSINLLLLLGGQPQQRLMSVEGHYEVLAYFLTEDLFAEARRVQSAAQIREALKTSLSWAVGTPCKAAVAPDFQTLLSSASPTASGLHGPGSVANHREVEARTFGMHAKTLQISDQLSS